MHRQLARSFVARLALAGVVLLLACGGGGGDGPAAAATAGPFEVSGSVTPAASTDMDGDVNDPAAPRVSNDGLAEAQEIANPVTVGGYVNRPGTGPAGASFSGGDEFDYYRASLAAGQTLRLFIAGDGLADDLDLALLELDGTEVAASDGVSGTEEITVPASGDYAIEVMAFSGASNYVLSVGQDLSAAAAPATGAGSRAEFVPGEWIVRFRPGPARASAAARRARAAALGMTWAGGGARNEALLACRSEREIDGAFRALGVERLRRSDPSHRAPRARDRMRRNTRLLAKTLRGRADVVSADLNYVRRAAADPADEFYDLQWHYPQINLPQAWDNVSPASGVVVAVVDSGVALAHPDLQGQLVAGYDFVQDVASAFDGDGCDPDPDDPGDGQGGGSGFHGTHVTGTVVARTSLQPPGDAQGVAGGAWNARVMPLRALGRGGVGTDFDVMQAVRYAAGLANDCGALPAERAHVINLSLGGAGHSSAFESLIAEVRDAGVTVVAAAGNDSSSAPFYPAAYDGVVSVSAVDVSRTLAPYSNFGAHVDVAAPGGNLAADVNGDGFADGVLSTFVDDSGPAREFVYAFFEGTSMAAPHVSAAVALMLGVNPDLTPADIDALLAAGRMTEDIGSPTLYGHGLIDAFAAVAAAYEARGGTPPASAPQLKVDPSGLNFGAIGTQADLDASNAGDDRQPLVVTGFGAATDDGAPWLSVAPRSVDAAGLGGYRVTVDRAGLADGAYTGSVWFRSDANEVAVPVILQVGAVAPGPIAAGHHFVLLLDPDTLDTVRALSVLARNGSFFYRFRDVPAGEYLLLAGSDSDNDSVICDPGEACGAYPTLDQSARVVVDRDRSGLDFDTGFSPQVASSRASTGYARRPGARPPPPPLPIVTWLEWVGSRGTTKAR